MKLSIKLHRNDPIQFISLVSKNLAIYDAGAWFNKHKDKGFIIIAINDGDPTPDVLQFVKDYGLTFPVWLDPNYIATEQAFKTLNLPSSYVIDRNGRIQLMWVGGISRKTLDQYVTPLITEIQ